LKKTLLLVEDSKLQKIKTERILVEAGYLVLNAADGEEALVLAREAVPDLILLDMLLPRLGGEEVLHALGADSATEKIPVIILSSLPRTNEAKLRMEGAAEYFEKSRLNSGPTGEQELVQTIERVLRETTERDKVHAQGRSAAT